MANRIRPIDVATAYTRRQLIDIGRELRISRLASGKRQVDVSRAIGLSPSQICRIENGIAANVSARVLSRLGAAVGLRLSLKVYPTTRRLLDQPQLLLFRDLRERARKAIAWRSEVPMPIAGDLRAADAVGRVSDGIFVCELWTRLFDFQGQTRPAFQKKRDLGAEALIVVLRATHANRRALRLAEPAATDSFPLRSRAVLASLADGRCPKGDARREMESSFSDSTLRHIEGASGFA